MLILFSSIKHEFSNPDFSSWILDTGATGQMVPSINFYSSITSIVSTTVKLPYGHSESITRVGSVQISEHPILCDVLCLSSFTFNFITISNLTKSFTFFFPLTCVLSKT